jgi:hypothetical protein
VLEQGARNDLELLAASYERAIPGSSTLRSRASRRAGEASPPLMHTHEVVSNERDD